jgi:hypothetical protein
MKHIFLTYLLLAVFGFSVANAQSKKVQDDIYYTAEDAKKDAEEAEKERLLLEEARAKRAAERKAQSDAMGYESGEEEYIDYDDDEYYYANRFNRFNGLYVGASYWAYDPFFWDPWWGGGYYARSWGWGPSWGVGVGFGGPYWSSYWGWNCWYGYPGFYSAWNSPWMYGGYGGMYGGYYNGFYDGYYAGAYGGGAMSNVRSVSYGPRSSVNRYPGSLRATSGRTGSGMSGGTRGQLRRSTGELREGTNNRNYSRSASPVSSPSSGVRSTERRGGTTTEQMDPAEPARNNSRYNSGATNRPARSYNNNTPNNRSYQAEPAQQAPSRSYQRSEPAQQRSQPSYQRSQPAYQQRSTPSYNTPSRSYSSPGSSPSRGGGSFGGGRSGGGRR